MSEPPPRGAERDLFRDTWVRYLGEWGVRDTATPPPMWLERQGWPDAGQGPGEGGRIIVLILHGPEVAQRGLGTCPRSHSSGRPSPALRVCADSLQGVRSSGSRRNRVSGLPSGMSGPWLWSRYLDSHTGSVCLILGFLLGT